VAGVVSFGGGSPIDSAKIVALRVGGLPHVAMPTTMSVAELAAGAGFTDETGTKGGLRDPKLLPDVVIYDAELTLQTPMELWLSTGIRALDHAVEGFLEDRRPARGRTASRRDADDNVGGGAGRRRRLHRRDRHQGRLARPEVAAGCRDLRRRAHAADADGAVALDRNPRA